MSAWVMGVIAFVCVFTGSVIGLRLGTILPKHHLTGDSRDAVRIGAGLIATLSALVLGLLISSAKNSFDEMNSALTQGSATLIMLDRTMAQYGPEMQSLRQALRDTIIERTNMLWPGHNARLDTDAIEKLPAMETILIELQKIAPHNETQQFLHAQAMQLCGEILKIRWLTIERSQSTMSPVFHIVLLFWITILFGSIGLFAPSNKTVLTVMLVCAISIGGAVFLIEEMNQPLSGLIKVSSAPLLKAIELMGR
jgi:hypothetical protein